MKAQKRLRDNGTMDIRPAKNEDRAELFKMHKAVFETHIEDFQGKGFGKRLVNDLQKRAMALGLPLELVVFRTNSRALRFYERCGFRIVGKTDEFFEMSWNYPNTIIQ